MKNSSIKFLLLLFLMHAAFNAQADSLSEISNFSKEICDDIDTKGSHTISKTEIQAKLEGEIGKVAKFIGAKIGADGKITIGENKVEYDGLPYDSLSEQMTNSRSCKLEISKMLINERKKLVEGLDKNQLSSREDEIKELSNEYRALRERFYKLTSSNKQIDSSRHLPEGRFDSEIYDAHIQNKLGAMGGQMQSVLLMMTFMPIVREISEGSEQITDTLDDAKEAEISKSQEFMAIKNKSRELNQRSQAILLESVDLVQKKNR